MAHIMRPRPGEDCHDYACGSAGLLMKLQLVARELDPTSKVPLKLTAQELQAENYAIAQMNGVIHDMDIEIARGDTMINPKFRTADGKVRTHDIVVANPIGISRSTPTFLPTIRLTAFAPREASPPEPEIGRGFNTRMPA